MILLAIIVFAALSYTVTQNFRGGGKDASSEEARSQASALIQYGALLESTISRTRVVNNIPEWGLDFADGTGPSASSSNATCGNTNCRIFKQPNRDGLLESLKFGEEYIDPRWRTQNPSWGGGSGTASYFNMIHIQNVGTTLPELALAMQGIRPEICNAINEILWQMPIGYGNEFYSAGADYIYSGTLTTLPTTFGTFGDDSAFFKGKSAG
ncbi:MAG: hypothetical protein EBV03_13640, partial [Proteobacteria bacterium]|nr:hypothetical protein [Pseudomonadota bacterium]